MAFTIRVNGGTHRVDVDGDTPLLWVLRDAIGLTGTKYGCGVAQCGACTVLLDGKPLRSWTLPVSALGNAEVATIEGGTHMDFYDVPEYVERAVAAASSVFEENLAMKTLAQV